MERGGKKIIVNSPFIVIEMASRITTLNIFYRYGDATIIEFRLLGPQQEIIHKCYEKMVTLFIGLEITDLFFSLSTDFATISLLCIPA